MLKYHNKYENEPNRLQSWNYSNPGRYYLTICTHNRVRLFGKIENNKMDFSEYGEIVRFGILNVSTYHKRVTLDEWIIMPDYMHLIIELGNWDYDNGVSLIGGDVGKIRLLASLKNREFSLRNCTPKQYRAYRRKMLIPKTMGKLQKQTSKQINILRNTQGKTNW